MMCSEGFFLTVIKSQDCVVKSQSAALNFALNFEIFDFFLGQVKSRKDRLHFFLPL